MIKKITIGFVVQTFDDQGKCTGQEFVAGDDVTYENSFGDGLDKPDEEFYYPLDMVQPK